MVIRLLFLFIFLSACASAPLVVDEALREKAMEGSAPAQYEMGMIYYRQVYSGSWSLKEAAWEGAVPWFEMAARQGDARAQYRLSLYYSGRDDEKSFMLLQVPAQQGIANAQHALGVKYGQARGTPQDLVLAYKWIGLGQEGGIGDLPGNVADLDWLIWKGKMSPEQVAEGRRLIEEHTSKSGKSRTLGFYE